MGKTLYLFCYVFYTYLNYFLKEETWNKNKTKTFNAIHLVIWTHSETNMLTSRDQNNELSLQNFKNSCIEHSKNYFILLFYLGTHNSKEV